MRLLLQFSGTGHHLISPLQIFVVVHAVHNRLELAHAVLNEFRTVVSHLLLMLREMISDVKKLPDCQHTREIRAFAENCGKETDAMWESWGIPERYLDSDDPEDLLDLLEMELIPPELVGYRYEPEYIPNELEDESEDDSGNDDAAYNLLDIMEKIIGEAADRVNMVHEALKKGKETLCAG